MCVFVCLYTEQNVKRESGQTCPASQWITRLWRGKTAKTLCVGNASEISNSFPLQLQLPLSLSAVIKCALLSFMYSNSLLPACFIFFFFCFGARKQEFKINPEPPHPLAKKRRTRKKRKKTETSQATSAHFEQQSQQQRQFVPLWRRRMNE